ncbi:MAG: hypothetical protein V1660_00270 [archaeon]
MISNKIRSLAALMIPVGLLSVILMGPLARDVKKANIEFTKPYKTYTVEGKVVDETYMPAIHCFLPEYTVAVREKYGNVKKITFHEKTAEYNAVINRQDNVKFTAVAANEQDYTRLQKKSSIEQKVTMDLIGPLNYNPSWKLEKIK